MCAYVSKENVDIDYPSAWNTVRLTSQCIFVCMALGFGRLVGMLWWK